MSSSQCCYQKVYPYDSNLNQAMLEIAVYAKRKGVIISEYWVVLLLKYDTEIHILFAHPSGLAHKPHNLDI